MFHRSLMMLIIIFLILSAIAQGFLFWRAATNNDGTARVIDPTKESSQVCIFIDTATILNQSGSTKDEISAKQDENIYFISSHTKKPVFTLTTDEGLDLHLVDFRVQARGGKYQILAIKDDGESMIMTTPRCFITNPPKE